MVNLNKNKKVYIGMSGGVDSSLSAYLLKEAGFDVTGVFIKVWQPEFIPCTWREDRLDAMRVAAQIGIPFKTLDLEKEYKEGVIDYMISEYKLGRTPNPDVFCNKEVKFGAFLNWAIKNGADYVATGHYAKTDGEKLYRGNDDIKDQSYFLWTLKKEQLEKILLPIGNLNKKEVRKMAEKKGILTALKKDSQGLCFVSNLDMKQFLKHFIKSEKGDVINESGEIIGFHDGATFYTLGERHGFTINRKSPDDKPYYVIGKDVSKNIIIVSNVSGEKNKEKREFNLIDSNFFKIFYENIKCQAQIRYHGEFLDCEVKKVGNIFKAYFKKPILVSSGQSIVFYDRDTCLGGGIVE